MMKRNAMRTLLVMGMIVVMICCWTIGAMADNNREQPLMYLSLWEDTSAQEGISFTIIGKVSGGNIETLAFYDDMLIGGEPLSAVDREDLQWDDDGFPAYQTTCPLVEEGSVISIIDIQTGTLAGTATIENCTYFYEESSGSEMLNVGCMLDLPLAKGHYLGIAYNANVNPRPVTKAQSGSGEQAVVNIHVDIDGDGTEEALFWAMSGAGDSEDMTEHPIEIKRNEQTLSTVNFFYDNDYTNPVIPALLDINGDGVYELLLAGEGHNEYMNVYLWENDAFVETELGFYSGD